MFNSTLTVNEDVLCPVDGSIMITGILIFVVFHHMRSNFMYSNTVAAMAFACWKLLECDSHVLTNC